MKFSRCTTLIPDDPFTDLESNCMSFIDGKMYTTLLRPDIFTPDLGDPHIMEDEVTGDTNSLSECTLLEKLDILYTVDRKALRKVVRSSEFDAFEFLDSTNDLLKVSRYIRAVFPTRDLASKEAYSEPFSTWERFKFEGLDNKHTVIFSTLGDAFLARVFYRNSVVVSPESACRGKNIKKGVLSDWQDFVKEGDLVIVSVATSDGMGLEVSSKTLDIVCDILQTNDVIFQTTLDKVPIQYVEDFRKKYPHDEEIVVLLKKNCSGPNIDPMGIANRKDNVNIQRTKDVMDGSLPKWEFRGFQDIPETKDHLPGIRVRSRNGDRNCLIKPVGNPVSLPFRKRVMLAKPAAEYPIYVVMKPDLPIIFQDYPMPSGEGEYLFACLVNAVKAAGGEVAFDPGIGWYAESGQV